MRIKRGNVSRKRHKKILKLAKGFIGARSRIFKVANTAVMKALKYAYRDRRTTKRNMRRLWIVRINAAVRERGMSYSRFVNACKKANILVNRKMLAELAVNDKEAFDVVFSNPPYMTSDFKSVNSIRNNARHDHNLPIDDLCKTAFNLLKFGGKFYVVYSATRACELIHMLVESNLEPKRMFFTENGKGKIILVIIEAVKGGKHGVNVLPNLITNDKTGEYIKTLQTKYFIK